MGAWRCLRARACCTSAVAMHETHSLLESLPAHHVAVQLRSVDHCTWISADVMHADASCPVCCRSAPWCLLPLKQPTAAIPGGADSSRWVNAAIVHTMVSDGIARVHRRKGAKLWGSLGPVFHVLFREENVGIGGREAYCQWHAWSWRPTSSVSCAQAMAMPSI